MSRPRDNTADRVVTPQPPLWPPHFAHLALLLSAHLEESGKRSHGRPTPHTVEGSPRHEGSVGSAVNAGHDSRERLRVPCPAKVRAGGEY